jgi:predicted RNase H-like HicB family nuclease
LATSPRQPDGDERFSIEFEQEADGRWLAEIPQLPGVMAYGTTRDDAKAAVTALALRVIADGTEQRVRKPPTSIRFS